MSDSMHEHPEQHDWDRSGSVGHCGACHLEDSKNNVARAPLELHDCDKAECPQCGGYGHINMTHMFRGVYTGGNPCPTCNSSGRVRKSFREKWLEERKK